MNAWFADFATRCAEIASRRRAPIEAPHLNAEVAREVLDLTRVVARGSERQFAPLAAFVAGQAVERMSRTASLDNAEIVAFLQELKEALPQPSAP
ncbi:MAG TPA: DUF6457 domain-containing protein [Candidatus Dormibacteraeota bacterium]